MTATLSRRGAPGLARSLLIVEDDEVNRLFLEQFLADHGFAVEAVGTGELAVDALRARSYDLVLLDLMLPGMNGGEVAWAAREAGLGTPILAVSAALDVWDEADLRDLGVSATLGKPFANDDLLAEVERLVGRRQEVGRAVDDP